VSPEKKRDGDDVAVAVQQLVNAQQQRQRRRRQRQPQLTLVETLPIHRANGDTKLFWIDFGQNGDVIGNCA